MSSLNFSVSTVSAYPKTFLEDSKMNSSAAENCFNDVENLNSVAVQQEQDNISTREDNSANYRRPNSGGIFNPANLLTEVSATSARGRTVATILDVIRSLNQQAVSVSNWANALPGFSKIGVEDQNMLIQHHTAIHLLFEVAARSLNTEDSVLMDAGKFIGTDPSAPTLHLGQSILQQLVKPMQVLELDEVELGSLKASLFFESCMPNITDRNAVFELQSEVFVALEEHVRDKLYATRDRFTDICALMDSFTLISSALKRIVKQ